MAALPLAAYLPQLGLIPPGFDILDSGAIPPDSPETVEAARAAAAARTARPAQRMSFDDRWEPAAGLPRPIPYIDQVAGLLGGGGAAAGSAPEMPVPAPDVPLPQPRPADLGAPVDTREAGAPMSLAPTDYADQMPQNATLTAGSAQPAGNVTQSPGAQGPSFLDRIFDPNKAATWLALGAGFSGAPSIGTGMRRAFSNAVPAIAADRAQIMKQSTISDTYRALVSKGVPPAEALAASQNPDIMKAVAGKYFEAKARVPHEIGTDWLGNKIMGSFDPNTGKFYDASGSLIQGGSGGGSGGGAPGSSTTVAGGMNMLAKGVGQYNPDLPADEYLGQFGPEVQAAIKAYVAGETMPTGNPRLKGFEPKVKEWARLYGDKQGIVVSDSEFSKKRTMRNEIARSTPNSMGGILANGKSAFGHLATLGENFVDLGNYSGPSVPGGSHVGRIGNIIGNQIAPTPEISGKMEAVRDNAGKYGAEATKFYAGTGGGVEERLSALHGIAKPGTLAAEQAAYMRTEKDLMLTRLREKEGQIREVLGDEYLRQHPVMTKETQHDIDRIDAAIKRLTGLTQAPAATAPAGRRTSTGVQWGY